MIVGSFPFILIGLFSFSMIFGQVKYDSLYFTKAIVDKVDYIKAIEKTCEDSLASDDKNFIDCENFGNSLKSIYAKRADRFLLKQDNRDKRLHPQEGVTFGDFSNPHIYLPKIEEFSFSSDKAEKSKFLEKAKSNYNRLIKKAGHGLTSSSLVETIKFDKTAIKPGPTIKLLRPMKYILSLSWLSLQMGDEDEAQKYMAKYQDELLRVLNKIYHEDETKNNKDVFVSKDFVVPLAYEVSIKSDPDLYFIFEKYKKDKKEDKIQRLRKLSFLKSKLMPYKEVLIGSGRDDLKSGKTHPESVTKTAIPVKAKKPKRIYMPIRWGRH